MEIYLLVKRIARQQELLGRRQRLGVETEGRDPRLVFLVARLGRLDLDLADADLFHQPVEVDRAGARAGHQPVTPQIIQPIGVERAGHDGMVNVGRIIGFQQIGHGIAEAAAGTEVVQQRPDFAVRVPDDLRGPPLMPLVDAARLLHALEGVAERPVAQVVQQRRDDRHLCPVRVGLVTRCVQLPLDDTDQNPRGMEYTNTMGEASMGRAGKHELGDAELPDAAQALEFRRIQQRPGKLVKLVALTKHDNAMDRVPNAISAGHR